MKDDIQPITAQPTLEPALAADSGGGQAYMSGPPGQSALSVTSTSPVTSPNSSPNLGSGYGGSSGSDRQSGHTGWWALLAIIVILLLGAGGYVLFKPAANNTAVGQVGRAGAQGSAGQPGSDGQPGQNGKAGQGGKAGANGINGSDGAKGATGPTGATGQNGQNGPKGDQGTQGIQGVQGLPGSNDCIQGVCVSRQSSSPGTQETGNINLDGTIIAANFQGNGANITSVDSAYLNGYNAGYFTNASNVASGTLANARLSSSVTLQGNSFNGTSQLVQLAANGYLPVLDGSNLSNVNALTLQGNNTSYFTNASNVASGTLADARLSSNVALLNAASQTFSGNLAVSGNQAIGGTLTVSGAAQLASLTVLGSTSLASLTVSGATTLASIIVNGNAVVGGSLTYGSTLSGSCADLPGYIWVPGDSRYGTMPGFCVMKYDAKNNGSGQAVSTASAAPWVSISQQSAEDVSRAACNSGCHLITDREWMTIAENALVQPANWTGGSVGSSALYSGHNDNAPANALAASSDDTNGYYGETNTGGNQRRVLWLSTGNGPCLNNGTAANANCTAIWDIGGNVWNWTDAWILGSEEPTITGSEGFAYRQFAAITKWGALNYANPTDRGWNSSQGLGQIYSDGTATNSTQYAFLRGGYWGNGSNAGAFALLLDVGPPSTGSVVGFRVAR